MSKSIDIILVSIGVLFGLVYNYRQPFFSNLDSSSSYHTIYQNAIAQILHEQYNVNITTYSPECDTHSFEIETLVNLYNSCKYQQVYFTNIISDGNKGHVLAINIENATKDIHNYLTYEKTTLCNQESKYRKIEVLELENKELQLLLQLDEMIVKYPYLSFKQLTFPMEKHDLFSIGYELLHTYNRIDSGINIDIMCMKEVEPLSSEFLQQKINILKSNKKCFKDVYEILDEHYTIVTKDVMQGKLLQNCTINI